MPKIVPASFSTAIKREVTTLSSAIKITRADGKVIRLTDHTSNLTIKGKVYSHTTVYSLSAFTSGSSFSSDGGTLNVTIDGTIFTRSDIENNLFKLADIEIFVVDYELGGFNVATIREGWLGQMSVSETLDVGFTVNGLLKQLDLQVGQPYQPACQATFGDKACRFPVDRSQQRLVGREYTPGDWITLFDEGSATAIPITNADFETAVVPATQPIPGWTKQGIVPFITTTTAAGVTADTGTTFLYGNTETNSAPASGEEFTIHTDVDLVAAGMTTTQLDAGSHSIRLSSATVNILSLGDAWNVGIQFLSASGELILAKSTGWKTNDASNTWQENSIISEIPAGARVGRIQLSAKKVTSGIVTVGFDSVKMFFWDHDAVDPTNGVIYRCSKIQALTGSDVFNMPNFDFSANFAVANTNLEADVANWSFRSTNDWWSVTNFGIAGAAGYFLRGGDDASGVQKTYSIFQSVTFDVASNAEIDLGNYAIDLKTSIGHAGLTTQHEVLMIFKDAGGAVLATKTVGLVSPTSTGFQPYSFFENVPALSRKMEIELRAQSPAGVSLAAVGFDTVQMWIYNVDKAAASDPLTGVGVASTIFPTVPGEIARDGPIVWKTFSTAIKYDIVATVVDATKTITATNLSGIAGQFEGANILWLSGANSGRTSTVRIWDDATKTLKMYFDTLDPIVVGDKFRLVEPCGKRFNEDCKIRFGNTLNFRGFPHLPGKLDS